MTLPIFWRLVLSHLGILLLSGAACLYSIVELGSVSGSARSALVSSQEVTADKEALIDTFLSQARYGGKYLITHNQGQRDQFLQFKKDFVDYLNRLKHVEKSDSIGATLSRIERLNEQYQELFDREAAYIDAHQNYAQTRYQQERDKIVKNTLEEFDALKAQLGANLQEKLESIDSRARTGRRIAIISTFAVLVLGAIFSLKVSRSLEASLSEASVSVFTDPWTEKLRITGATLPARLWNRIKLQANRFSVFAFRIREAWIPRSTNPKTPACEKATDL